jgi:hypothetical protein
MPPVTACSRDSAQQTVTHIDARADESGVLAKTTVLEIVHAEGAKLQEAAHACAAAISARDPEVLRLFVPALSHAEEAAVPPAHHDVADAAAVATAVLIGFPGGPTDSSAVERDEPRAVDPDVVLVELDEVKVHAQAHTTRKQVLALTAVVMITGRCWHLAATTAQELAYQVGALLAVLGVHCGARRLLVLADGARWIRDWFEGLAVEGGAMIASNRVEKFNDWSVSARCKHQGVEWTEAGVVSLAVLEAARRKGELPTWRAKHRLPAWKIPRSRK